MVPVADCTHERFSAHAKTEMRFADYAEYWRALVGCKAERSRVSVEGHRERDIREGKGMKLLYLKDWHFARYRVEQLNSPVIGVVSFPDFSHATESGKVPYISLWSAPA